jgi:hypothetical protein
MAGAVGWGTWVGAGQERTGPPLCTHGRFVARWLWCDRGSCALALAAGFVSATNEPAGVSQRASCVWGRRIDESRSGTLKAREGCRFQSWPPRGMGMGFDLGKSEQKRNIRL